MADNSNGKKIDDNYFNDTIKKNNSNKKLNKDLKINSESKDNINETYKKKVLFINRKRGRKIKELNYINIGSSHDRFSDDNLKRKIKTHFHNYIISLLNSKVYDNSIKFVKMSHNITKNITVEFNKDLCNKQIKEIITKVASNFHKKNRNEENINYIMRNKEEYYEAVNILNMTYQDLYLNYYLKSTKHNCIENPEVSFESHKEELKKKFGEEYVKRYIKNAQNLINFFQTCKKRIRRKKEFNNSSIKESTALASTETFQNNNQNLSYLYDEDVIYKYKVGNNNKIDKYTQTNRIETDDESEV
jgi:hypothetical protein